MISTSEFLSVFREPEEPLHLRAFKPKKAPETKENRALLWGTSLAELSSSQEMQSALREANKTRGVYFGVNVGGATDDSIMRFTAFFAEADNSSISEQHAAFDLAPLRPSIRVETRNSVHGYYLIAGDCVESEWRGVHEGLIAHFDSDPKIKNPSRVMRLPNFDHIHLNGSGLERKRVIVHTFEPERRYTVGEMLKAFPVPEAEEVHRRSNRPSIGPFASWEELNTEAGNRVRNLSGARTDHKGWTHAPGICHSSAEGKALFVAPDGAYGCLNKCTGAVIRACLGLPEHPVGQSVPKSNEHQSKPAKKRGKQKGAATRSLFPDPEIWPESVNGSALLDEIVSLLRRYVDASEAIYRAAAIWALFTHAFECFFILPILCLTSPAKRSGKTTLLHILSTFVARPLTTSSISAAALFRGIEAFKPTLLIDEADTFLNDNPELHGILNSGHTKATAQVIRCDENFNVKAYSTFAPKLVAMIGKPKDTIVDRSIVLGMKRAPANRKLEYLRADKLAELGASLRSKAARFAVDNADTLKLADPAIPAEITSARARDNWRSLLAIADACGEQWSKLARLAAIELSGAADLDNESQGEALLGDIKQIFNAANGDRLFSKTIVQELIAVEDRPWSEANNGKPISPAWLSRRLRPFGILSKSIRIDPHNAKGYELSTFRDAFTRYLPDTGEYKRHNVTNPINIDENAKANHHNETARDDSENVTSRTNIGLCRCDVFIPPKGSLESEEDIIRAEREAIEWEDTSAWYEGSCTQS